MQSPLAQIRSAPEVTTTSRAAAPASSVHGTVPAFVTVTVNVGCTPGPYEVASAVTARLTAEAGHACGVPLARPVAVVDGRAPVPVVAPSADPLIASRTSRATAATTAISTATTTTRRTQ